MTREHVAGICFMLACACFAGWLAMGFEDRDTLRRMRELEGQ